MCTFMLEKKIVYGVVLRFLVGASLPSLAELVACEVVFVDIFTL